MEATPTDVVMMRRALDLARQAAALGEVPVAAVVYRESDILGEGHNRREFDADPTAHAEMIALRAAARTLGTWRLDDCSLAVTLEPCPMCAGAMVNARLARVVYAAGDPKMGCVRTLYQLCDDARFNHRLEVIPDVLAAEAGDMLSSFFRQLRHPDRPPKPRPPSSFP
ncbi:MAG: nucleoside deaminase [Phycisphaeraceae bacterium]|nr:nucleoside deaminase [Phycisphaeraceae bacterium]